MRPGITETAVGLGQGALEALGFAAQDGADEGFVHAEQFIAHQVLNADAPHLLRRLAEPFEIGGVGETAPQVAGPVGHHSGNVVGQGLHEALAGGQRLGGLGLPLCKLHLPALIDRKPQRRAQHDQAEQPALYLQIAAPCGIDAFEVASHGDDQGFVLSQLCRLYRAQGHHAFLAGRVDDAGQEAGLLAAVPVPGEEGAWLRQVLAGLAFPLGHHQELNAVAVGDRGPHVRRIEHGSHQGLEIVRVQGGGDEPGKLALRSRDGPHHVDAIHAERGLEGRRNEEHPGIVVLAGGLEVVAGREIDATQFRPARCQCGAVAVQHQQGTDAGHGVGQHPETIVEARAPLAQDGLPSQIRQRCADRNQVLLEVLLDHSRLRQQPALLADLRAASLDVEIEAGGSSEDQQRNTEDQPLGGKGTPLQVVQSGHAWGESNKRGRLLMQA